MKFFSLFFGCAGVFFVSSAMSAGTKNVTDESLSLPDVSVSAMSSLGHFISAGEGTVVAEQIEQRPVGRAGEVLETVPGLIATQHSGEGKANQYFLRGFNLDHGTDFATYIDGMPVNLPSHGHGQGYTDINFIIPELIESLDYRKGPYHVQQGNFASAGSVNLHSRTQLEHNLAKLTLGEFGYQRLLLAGDTRLSEDESLLLAVEGSRYDGPWQVEQQQEKYSALSTYLSGNSEDGFMLTGMAYQNDWTATDHIPQRLLDQGGGRFSSLDPDSGGISHRRSLSFQGWNDINGRELRSRLYLIDYGLKLYANHTYALDQQQGDEFHQNDQRLIAGGGVVLDLNRDADSLWQAGMDVRQDRISDVSLSRSNNRQIRERLARHRIEETLLGLFVSHHYHWSRALQTQLGLRWDYIQADVDNRLSGQSFARSGALLSPKFNLMYQLQPQTRLFFNLGQGYHSNDARGFTELDATPLVKSLGADLGLVTEALTGLQLSLAAWWLQLDSELVFLGDEAITEASDKSERRGLEASVFWQANNWLIIDSDLAFSRARLKPRGEKEHHIPGAVEQVFSLGLTIDGLGSWDAGLRLRHFGKFALNEDNSKKAEAVTLLNAQATYQINQALKLGLELINISDEKGNDITYLYESRLPGESVPAGEEGIEDVHFHPVEPRMARANLTYQF